MLNTSRQRNLSLVTRVLLLVGCALCHVGPAAAQQPGDAGRVIGDVTVRGNLIVLTLREGEIGKSKPFNLEHRTLRFLPEGSRFRAEPTTEQWDSAYGSEFTGGRAELHAMSFPFSGRRWTELSIGTTGTITFGNPQANPRHASFVGPDGGLAVDRFAELQQAGLQLVNTTPAIAAFFKPRLSGRRFLKELPDRTVVTWLLTEPYGGIQDWTWTPTVNKIQATLYASGQIDLTWDEVHAADAIVGVYPTVSDSTERVLGDLRPSESGSTLRRLRISSIAGLYLKADLEAQSGIPLPGVAGASGDTYRVCLSVQRSTADCTQSRMDTVVWSIQAERNDPSRADGSAEGQGPWSYMAEGPGVTPHVRVAGAHLSVRGLLPAGFTAGSPVWVSAFITRHGQSRGLIAPQEVTLADVGSPERDLSTLRRSGGSFPVIFESFHYPESPRAQDMTCSVLRALGDHFDMLAYYSDFRIDNPEAGTPSNGPLGGGPEGGKVDGIGAPQGDLTGYCTKGRFQWQFIQPVAVSANQMQEYPPEGLELTGRRDITRYAHQLAERTFNGKLPPYDYAMSQIGHEMGHRWAAFVSARVDGQMVPLGPVHWATGLEARVPFPYQRPTEASAMGGGVWQDNFDGTFTQLDDDYYVPAKGWSYLDLYLMGMIGPTEVPDFFLLRHLQQAGTDRNGQPIYKADRVRVTIGDVIAAEGPRMPDVDHAQKHFNTGMVLVVEPGKQPSRQLIDAVQGIASRWSDYWETTTGHRSTMTTDPR